MDKIIKKVIKKANSNDVERLIDNAEEYLKTKSNLFFAELFARNALKISKDDYPLDILDRLACLYYAKKKSAIDNNPIRPNEIDINKLKNRLNTLRKHKEIYEVLKPVIDRDREAIVGTINNAILSQADSAIAVVKAMGEEYVDPEYMDKLRALNERIKKHETLDYIKAINKNILRNILNMHKEEIIKNNFKIDKTKFCMKFIYHKACAYCKSGLMDLVKFYGIKNPKRGRGLSWEIDRKDPDKAYEEDNYEFVCYYCNNAKSDMFKEDEFKSIGHAIGKVIESMGGAFPRIARQGYERRLQNVQN